MRIPGHIITERCGRHVLEGWSAIATALGDSERTVRRYEDMDDPIPVNRKPGKRGRVWIPVDVLMEWAGRHGIG